jgi:hypothetical protein
MANVVQTLTLTQQSQSVSSNYSVVRILWTSKQDSNSYNNNTRTAKYWVTIKGVETEYSVSYTLPKNTTKTILDTTIVVPHSDDGRGSVSVRTWMDTRISAGVVEKSASLTLTTIPRKSALTVGNGTLGEQQTLYVSKQSADFTHTITYVCGTETGIICSKSSGTSIKWTPRIELCKNSPNSNSVSISFTIETYNGSTCIGSNPASATYAIPYLDWLNPSITPTFSDASGWSAKLGGWVQGHSKVHLDIECFGVYGSTIKSIKTVFEGNTYNGSSITTNAISGYDVLPVSITVTDTRERSRTITTEITVQQYSYPRVNKFTAKRCSLDENQNPVLNPAGDHILVSFAAEVTSLNSNNTARYYVGYKKVSEANHIAVEQTNLANQYSVDSTYVFPADTKSSYTVIFNASDHIKSSGTRLVLDVPSARKVVSFLKRNGQIVGMAINKVAEHDGFDFGMPVLFEGGGDYVVERGEKDGWTYRKWNSGTAECWKILTHKTAITTGWGALYHGTATARQSYPISFITKPLEQASLTAGSYQAILFPEKEGNGVNGALASACYNVCRPSSVTTVMEFYINLYVSGRWK